MKKPPPPLFLARRTYRRRRLMDAARLLPLLGTFLVLLPILWSPADTPEPETGTGAVYLFVVWFGLIAAAALLSRMLGPTLNKDADDRVNPGEDIG